MGSEFLFHPGQAKRVPMILLGWAHEHGYDWIRLDGEIGDKVPGLPTYEETWR